MQREQQAFHPHSLVELDCERRRLESFGDFSTIMLTNYSSTAMLIVLAIFSVTNLK